MTANTCTARTIAARIYVNNSGIPYIVVARDDQPTYCQAYHGDNAAADVAGAMLGFCGAWHVNYDYRGGDLDARIAAARANAEHCGEEPDEGEILGRIWNASAPEDGETVLVAEASSPITSRGAELIVHREPAGCVEDEIRRHLTEELDITAEDCTDSEFQAAIEDCFCHN